MVGVTVYISLALSITVNSLGLASVLIILTLRPLERELELILREMVVPPCREKIGSFSSLFTE